MFLQLGNVTEADTMVNNDNSISNKKEKNVVSDTNKETEDCVKTDTNQVTKDFSEMSIVPQAYNEWTPLEKDLYLKGVEIFGRNR